MRGSWPRTAFIDETQTADWYLLAAVIIDDRAVPELRAGIAELLVSAPKIHWWAESQERRRVLVAHLSRVHARYLAVVRLRRLNESDERCRRKCLETLLINLERLGVDRATFESRERHQNDRDRHALEYLRRSRVLRRGIVIDHRAGPAEPLLWLADILAGAIRVSRDGATDYVDLLAIVDVIEI